MKTDAKVQKTMTPRFSSTCHLGTLTDMEARRMIEPKKTHSGVSPRKSLQSVLAWCVLCLAAQQGLREGRCDGLKYHNPQVHFKVPFGTLDIIEA